MKPWKVPTADLMPLILAPTAQLAFEENKKGYIIDPYIPSGQSFSVCSSAAFRDIFVSCSQRGVVCVFLQQVVFFEFNQMLFLAWFVCSLSQLCLPRWC
jgi:hypothetical protein